MSKSLSLLVLEDDPIRMVQFRRRMVETGLAHTITHSETASGAIEHLSQSHFDLVLLDHDLGGRTYVDHNDEAEDCGMRVAEFLSIRPELVNRIGPIIVHSLNGPAAQSMVGLIGEASWVPFLWTQAVWMKFLKMPHPKDNIRPMG